MTLPTPQIVTPKHVRFDDDLPSVTPTKTQLNEQTKTQKKHNQNAQTSQNVENNKQTDTQQNMTNKTRSGRIIRRPDRYNH